MSEAIQHLKSWTNVRARAARQGVQAYRSDPADDPVVYFTIHHAVPRVYPDMDALRARIEDLEVKGAA